MAFVSNTQENENQSEEDTEERLSDAITFVRRKFIKSIRRLDKRWRTNVIDKMSDISPHSKSKDEEKPKGAKFFECEGFSHIQTKCSTFIRK